MSTVVGIGDCRASADAGDVLVTYALGSCVGVVVHDAVARVGGLLHILLPDSSIDPKRAKENPFVFADTGIPLLLKQCYALGARKERLQTRIAGGSQMSVTMDTLNVGHKNIQATRDILGRNGLSLSGEAVGGSCARTLRLKVGTGELSLQETAAAQKKVPPARHTISHGRR